VSLPINEKSLRVALAGANTFGDQPRLSAFSRATSHKAEPVFFHTDAEAMLALKSGLVDVAIAPFWRRDDGYQAATFQDITGMLDIVATRILRRDTSYDLIAPPVAVMDGSANETRPQTLAAADIVFASPSALRANVGLVDRLRASGATIVETETDEEAFIGMRRRLSKQLDRPSLDGRGRLRETGRVAALYPSGAAGSSAQTVVQHTNDIVDPEEYFLVLQRAKDKTVYFDKYRTTRARTRYFMQRIAALMLSAQQETAREPHGVNILLQFRRGHRSAGLGELESYLRNYGVRYNLFQYPERMDRADQEPALLDIEFSTEDFAYNPRRRLFGSVAKGALRLAFTRWKERSALVMGAMPIEEFRLPAPGARRWWREGARAAVNAFGETMFIRFSRLFAAAVFVGLLYLGVSHVVNS
jgi:hypothetical protein